MNLSVSLSASSLQRLASLLAPSPCSASVSLSCSVPVSHARCHVLTARPNPISPTSVIVIRRIAPSSSL
ncbi:hypothetical protein K523DRAFT_325350, partial [Schizophyllum commune Tattone D]